MELMSFGAEKLNEVSSEANEKTTKFRFKWVKRIHIKVYLQYKL